MPVFNTEKYVAEAIESVLSQTYSNLELICVDDGSTDRSCEIIRSFGSRVHLVENGENRGITKTRNSGVSAARGDYIAFIDADDIWKSDKLEKQLREFNKNPDLDICFALFECFLSPELPDAVKQLRYCPVGPNRGFISGTALFTRSLLERIGPFDEQLQIGEFIDWYTKAQDLGVRDAVIEEILYLRRIHETNTGTLRRDARSDYLAIARSALARRKPK